MAENSGIGNEALKALIKQIIQDESGGGLTLDSVYPVGSIYMSVNNVSPATFIGWTWEALDDGRVLIGAGSAHPAGETGGAENVTLTATQMPSHNHSGSVSLSGSTGSAGSHNHDRGTMNITGTIKTQSDAGVIRSKDGTVSGAFEKGSSLSHALDGTAQQGASYALNFDASNNWTGDTSSDGSHSHSLSGVTASITTNNAGSGQSHNNMQPYLSVYMWKRTE